MRVLLTADPELPVPPPLYGGIERIVDTLVRELNSAGHSVGLVAHPDSESPAAEHFAWWGRSSHNKVDHFRNSATLRSAVARFRPDVVHSFSRVLYMLPLLRSRLPKVMSYQRAPSRRSVKLGSQFGKGTLTFTGCSEHISQHIRNAGGQATTVHNCVDLNKYLFQPTVVPYAPLLFLSRVERIKGAHTAIEVAKRTKRHLIIAGNHVSHGEEGRYWRKDIEPHLRTGDIEYVGPVNDDRKIDLLQMSAAMIVPIEWDEPFGIVFAEALACGTPVISCPRGALPEIVRPGVDGFLVRSVEEACEAVRKLPSIRRADCRERAEKCFSSKVIAGQYEKLYVDVVKSKTLDC